MYKSHTHKSPNYVSYTILSGKKIYNECQKFWVAISESDDVSYGDLTDIDSAIYNSEQMGWVALGRGNNPSFGNINDLDPTEHTAEEMERISLSRGTSSTFN